MNLAGGGAVTAADPSACTPRSEPIAVRAERQPPPRDVLVAEESLQAVATLREAARQAFPGAMLHVVGTPAQARLMFSTLRPDFVAVHLNIADPSPRDFIAQARACNPRTRVAVVAGHGDDDRLLPALLDGASGFVLKHDAPGVIESQLREIHAGVLRLSPALARQLIRHVDLAGLGATLDRHETDLLTWVAIGDSLQEAAWRMHTELAAVLACAQGIYRKVKLSGAAWQT